VNACDEFLIWLAIIFGGLVHFVTTNYPLRRNRLLSQFTDLSRRRGSYEYNKVVKEALYARHACARLGISVDFSTHFTETALRSTLVGIQA